MISFIKNCFKEINVRCNDQQVTGVKKVLAFVFCAIIITLILGISATMFVGMLAVALCMIPIALVIQGIKLLVSVAARYYKSMREKKNIGKKYSEQLRQLGEDYSKNRDNIKNTLESLENCDSIALDEFGDEVAAQELVPIELEDIELYISYLFQINTADSLILDGLLSRLNELKRKLDTTLSLDARKELECEFAKLSFSVQDEISKYNEQINNMNDNFDKKAKKRRLFK